MLKKILFAVAAIVMGFLFMIAFYMSSIQSRMEDLVDKAVSTGDFTYILTSYDDLSNKNALYQERNTDNSIVSVYETGNYKSVTKLDTEYDVLVPSYSIIIGDHQRTVSDTSDGTYTYNKTGLKITTGNGNVLYYYDNGYNDGVIDKDYPNYKENIYADYDIGNNYPGVSLYEYQITLDFMESISADDPTIKSIEILSSNGNTYGNVINFENTLSYSSDTHNIMKTLMNKCYDVVDDKLSSDDLYDYYKNEWRDQFLAIDGCSIIDESSYYYTGSLYFKLIAVFVAYVIIMLAIGDTLVGKKRLINFFKNVSQKDNSKQKFKQNNDKVIEADVKVINEDVKDEENK